MSKSNARIMTKERFYEVYGKYPTTSELLQANANRIIEPTTTDKLKAGRIDRGFFMKKGVSEMRVIEQQLLETKTKEAKEWLEEQDLTCFKMRQKTKYTPQRKFIVSRLKNDFSLEYEQMARVLSKITGLEIKKGGLAWIYSNN